MTGSGGAIKNIAMGCGSRAGKVEQHSEGKPNIVEENCIGCAACLKICAHDAPEKNGGKYRINYGLEDLYRALR